MARRHLTDALCRLTSYCYADYLTQELRARSVESLDDLSTDEPFCKAFREKLIEPETVYDEVLNDAVNGNQAYSSNLLFVSNYLENKSCPALHTADQVLSQSYGSVVATWVSIITTEPEKVERLAITTAKTLPINYGVHDNNHFRPPSGLEIFDPIKSITALGTSKDESAHDVEQAKTFSDTTLGDWKSYAQMLVSLWESNEAIFDSAVRGCRYAVRTTL